MNQIKNKLYFVNFIQVEKLIKRKYLGSSQFSTADSPEDYAIKAENAKNQYYLDATIWRK